MDSAANSELEPRTFLQPIAAPSILGLYGFAGATFMVTAYLAGWYGNSSTEQYLAPFAAAFGGVAQFAAGMWAYKVRDAIATAMHGMWGAFWIGYGILFTLISAGALSFEAASTPLGFWFISLAAITLTGALAAMYENVALSAVLHTLWIGAALLAVGFLTGSTAWEVIAGYVLMLSAICAWYTGTALMLESVSGKAVLPVGQTRKAQQAPEVNRGVGEPGIAKGQ